MKRYIFFFLVAVLCVTPSFGAETKILTNHLGYEPSRPKHAVILGKASDNFSKCSLKEETTDQPVLSIEPKSAGPVQKWRDWYFWTLDFDSFSKEGRYYFECNSSAGSIRSFPFLIQRDLLERNTMSDVIYYFKEQRSAGEMDKADRHLKFDGNKPGTVDAHGGWWDATGDYGKHLSHLSFSTYFNPQQIPLVIYSLLKSYDQTKLRALDGFSRYQHHLLAEAMFGADYLVRLKVPNGFRRILQRGLPQGCRAGF